MKIRIGENLLSKKRGKGFWLSKIFFVLQFNKTEDKFDFHLRFVDCSAAMNLKDRLKRFSSMVFIDFGKLKWKDLSTVFFSEKILEWRNSVLFCFVLFPLEKKRWLFSIYSSTRDFVIGLSFKIDALNDLCFA